MVACVIFSSICAYVLSSSKRQVYGEYPSKVPTGRERSTNSELETLVPDASGDNSQKVSANIVMSVHSEPNDSASGVSDGHSTIEASSSSVYYNGVYWNNFEQVRSYMNQLATGDSSVQWLEHLYAWNGEKPFRKALIVSCGNGFVERDLYSKGIILSAVGIDINEELLDTARAEASKHNLPIRYYQIDSNKQNVFPEDEYDLVLNHAALHHVAYIDFHTRALSNLLRRTPGSVLVNYDFVGPHRNQYDADTWETIHQVNEESDECFTKPYLGYPHLPTMLYTDPSEAIHSELLISTLNRYFEPLWLRYLNGALAYELLTHNENLQRPCSSGANITQHISRIIEMDAQYSESHRGRELFMYSILKPRARWPSESDLDSWTKSENDRERKALQDGGLYYPMTLAHVRSHGIS